MADFNIGGGRSRAAVKNAGLIVVDKDFKPTNTKELLYWFVKEIVKDLTASLMKHDRDQPGDLLQSIGENSTVTQVGSKLSLKIALNDYWKFVDEGVDGTERSQGSQFKYKKNTKRIPLDAMKKYISTHGKVPKKKIVIKKRKGRSKESLKSLKAVKKAVAAHNREKEITSYAFALGSIIKRDGLRPTHFFTEVVNEELKGRMARLIGDMLKRDIEIDFTT